MREKRRSWFSPLSLLAARGREGGALVAARDGRDLAQRPDGTITSVEQPFVRRRRPPLRLIGFLVFALAPGLAASAYFLAVAADQFIASARFTVREVQTATLAPASDRLDGDLTVARPSQFNHVVAAYLTSHAVLDDVGKEINLRTLFRREEADFWARLPHDATDEELLDYWRSHVTATVDGLSGVVTLRVRAFRPGDALTLSETLIAEAETLVNELSQRRKLDALERAQVDAVLAETRLDEAIRAVSRIRNESGFIDPTMVAGENLRLLTSLLARRLELQSEFQVLSGSMRDETAQIRALRQRLETIERDIADVRASLAGPETTDRNLAAALARFETLGAERRFAQQLYDIAQRRLIEAEIDLERRSVYLGVFDPPRLPSESRYPERVPFSALAMAACIVLWSIAVLIWASVEDHKLA